MNVIAPIFRMFRDSPTYGRDRATLISGQGIGTAALLLNGAVMMFLLPVLSASGEAGFRTMSENLEFGQLLALILLGGASAFATLLIPLRLATLFWEPRNGRYFDQVVLSGISPLRFVIGKALSQNLFLGLILFLLVPYMVLSLTLGGVNLSFFAAGLFLVWMYCMTLALATIWLALYVNEVLAALTVIFAGGMISLFGCVPFSFMPILLSPFPMLAYPVYASIPETRAMLQRDLFTIFSACALSMAGFSLVALIGIYLGPLFGIIRENSTFGEVIRTGDSKRKRWVRFRLHIQRPSEIAFFYENRGGWILRYEGLIRWGVAMTVLLLLSVGGQLANCVVWTKLIARAGAPGPMLGEPFLGVALTIHGIAMLLAVIVFSHSKNTTFLRLPFAFGRRIEIARLDSIAFFLFASVSSAAVVAIPFEFQERVAVPAGFTIFPNELWSLGMVRKPNLQVDVISSFIHFALAISLLGLVLYAFQRLVCLRSWMRSSAAVVVLFLYGAFAVLAPLALSVFVLEMSNDLRRFQFVLDVAPTIGAITLPSLFVMLFNGSMGPSFPDDVTPVPFYVFHLGLLIAALLAYRRSSRKVREEYLTEPQETAARV